MNTCDFVPGQQMYIYPLGIYLGVEELGHRIYMCLVLIILPGGFLTCLHRFILSLSEDERSSCSNFSPTFDIVSSFWYYGISLGF